ncbi:hypothetical protein CPAR01_16365 [Colletotrichum paranaense]|uniref:Uncharacterized protein n=1 Tax=Colletotrichum paranaense TaxID=1914294 RepID=A0ABQ9RWJ4_9PEZI|nr:uncharacterized protein CPAR01_16365 [Colletotrichum paranaense]KAK1516749.1 hypothetical protein CPAR01_16365 [Colletotrichum paranaense]
MSIEPERRKKELMRERVIYFFKTRTYFSTCRRLLLSQFSLNFLDCVRKGIVCFCSSPCLFPQPSSDSDIQLIEQPSARTSCEFAYLRCCTSFADGFGRRPKATSLTKSKDVGFDLGFRWHKHIFIHTFELPWAHHYLVHSSSSSSTDKRRLTPTAATITSTTPQSHLSELFFPPALEQPA